MRTLLTMLLLGLVVFWLVGWHAVYGRYPSWQEAKKAVCEAWADTRKDWHRATAH
jgi:hypothetical protein